MLRSPRPRRASAFVIAAACSVALVACGQDTSEVSAAGDDQSTETVQVDTDLDREAVDSTDENRTDENRTNENSDVSADRTDLDEAQQRFASTVGADYTLTFEIVSSATAEAGLIQVEVVNGVATNVVYPDAITEQILPQIPILTVNDFFDRARKVLAEGGSVEVDFDEAYGYPLVMTLDPIPNAIDDEMSIAVRSVDPAEPSVESDGY